MKHLVIDMAYVRDVLVRLLETPSPSGRTDAVIHLIGGELDAMGLPFFVTRRGALVAGLEGEQDSPDRAVVVHADTTGAMVAEVKQNGRLRVVPVGNFSSRFAEGARVRVFADPDPAGGDVDELLGTIVPLLASGHAYGDAVDAQPGGWDHVEVRLDARTRTQGETQALGVNVGDFVALDSRPIITDTGFVNARHLDDKAGVAAALGAFRAVLESGVELPVSVHLLVTIAEEVGLGASHGLQADVAEMVSVDNAVVAPGQTSTETGVTLVMQDSAGPFDYHLTRRLLRLADELGLEANRDVFTHYRSDTAAALEAGAEMRAALVGFGVDASHGHERTHLDSIRSVAELLAAYVQTPLTFAWDATPRGPLEEFPEQEQVEDERRAAN